MPIIYCAIHNFDFTVSIHVIDNNNIIAKHLINLEEIYEAVPALAKLHETTKIVLGGGKFGAGFAEEIQTEAAMKYGINNLEIEVI